MTDEAKEARRAYRRKYHRANAEKINAYQKRWRKANPDKVKAYQAKYWQKKASERLTIQNGKIEDKHSS